MQDKHVKYFLLILLVISSNSFAQTWEKVNMSFSGNDSILSYARINFVTRDIGWISTMGYLDFGEYRSILLETTNGGENWKLKMNLNKTISVEETYNIDSNYIWFMGLSGNLLFSQNMGLTWDTSSITYQNEYLAGGPFGTLYFFNTKMGVAFNNYRWFTKDGGYTWERGLDTTTIFYLPTDVYFINERLGWVVNYLSDVTDVGSIANTIDGGKIWFFQEKRAHLMQGVYFLDSLKGFAVGSNVWEFGAWFYKTSDGGINWEKIPFYHHYKFKCIEFIDSLNGWIGGSGEILRTTDGGESWSTEIGGIQTDFEQLIILKKEKIAYAFGKDWNDKTHTLMRADLSNLTNIKEERDTRQEKYILLENYPNPFNSETKIKFSLPLTSEVKVIIYDIIGKEIKRLLDDTHQPGEYEITWNGTDNSGGKVPSGIYFITMEAGNFRKAIKSVFLK